MGEPVGQLRRAGLRPRLVVATVVVVAVALGLSSLAAYVLSAIDVRHVANREELLASLRLRLATTTGVLLVVVAGVAVFAERRLTRPIDELRGAAERLRRGELGSRVGPHDGAFADVTASFDEMADELEATIARLHDAEAGRRRFVADVSHDLRTPVTAMTTAAELLAPALDDLPPASRRAGELLVAEVAHLRTLLEDLLEISRLDAGHVDVAHEFVPLSDHVVDVVEHLGLGEELGAGVTVTIPGDLVVDTDRRRLGSIIANLVANGVQHGKRPVEVRAASDGGTVVIEVRDHGAGIDPVHLDRLGERFYRPDESRQRRGGSGLGLAISKEQAAVLGGTLGLANAPDGGFLATVRLPVAPPPEPHDQP